MVSFFYKLIVFVIGEQFFNQQKQGICLSKNKSKSLQKKDSYLKRVLLNKKIRFSNNHPCTRSLNNLPAVKAGTRLAGIAIFSPVFGFNP